MSVFASQQIPKGKHFTFPDNLTWFKHVIVDMVTLLLWHFSIFNCLLRESNLEVTPSPSPLQTAADVSNLPLVNSDRWMLCLARSKDLSRVRFADSGRGLFVFLLQMTHLATTCRARVGQTG